MAPHVVAFLYNCFWGCAKSLISRFLSQRNLAADVCFPFPHFRSHMGDVFVVGRFPKPPPSVTSATYYGQCTMWHSDCIDSTVGVQYRGKTPWDGTRKIFNPIKTPFVVGNWVYPLLKGSNRGGWTAGTHHSPTYDFYQIHQVPSTDETSEDHSTSILEVLDLSSHGAAKSWVCISTPYKTPVENTNWENTIDGSEIPNNHRLDV